MMVLDKVLFSIEKLVCSYSLEDVNPVLKIDKLEIPRGKLVFLLGASGCGKSTLLETLGLMNNTIVSGNIRLAAENTDTPIDIHQLWKGDSEQQLNEVRKKHYSFIFQNTNLMENFTAYENVCLSGMIKENVPQEKVLDGAKQLMEQIKLPQSEVDLGTLAVNLSGGQRQRLAFARALNNHATILFGDEPTGNLDETNANELFGIIRSSLDSHLSAIIVSHDIHLAVKYADQIIVITKEEGKKYGEVKPENIFNREQWSGLTAEATNQFKDRLRSYYNSVRDAQQGTATAVKSTQDTSVSYQKLFLKKEGQVLAGRKMANFLILSLIISLTFLAIGFANGSLNYLEDELSNPFNNWVPISIPKAQSVTVPDLLDELNSDSLRTRFNYSKASAYVRPALRVLDNQDHKFEYALSRSVNVKDDGDMIRKDLFKPENLVRKGLYNGFKDENDIGVIVTSKFLQEFQYSPDANFIYCPFVVKDTVKTTYKDAFTGQPRDTVEESFHEVPVPVPIRAVVHRMPGKYGIMYPVFFFQTLMKGKGSEVFDSTKQRNSYTVFLETSDEKTAGAFRQQLQDFFRKTPGFQPFMPREVYQQTDTLGMKAGFRFETGFDSSVTDLDLLNRAIYLIRKSTAQLVDSSRVLRAFNYEGISEYDKFTRFDDISVYFNKLDSIKSFSNFIYDLADTRNTRSTEVIQLDDAKVKEKETFLFLSYVTRITSLLLLIFSTLSVCLFIFNLLKSHLSKVRMNIGTFKAIGLPNKESQDIYNKIILLFMSAAVALSMLVAYFAGNLINLVLRGNLSNESGNSFFMLFDWSNPRSFVNYITVLAIVVIVLSTLIMSWLTIKKMLNKTPGDLIYNR